jgi:hypothetical protein
VVHAANTNQIKTLIGVTVIDVVEGSSNDYFLRFRRILSLNFYFILFRYRVRFAETHEIHFGSETVSILIGR